MAPLVRQGMGGDSLMDVLMCILFLVGFIVLFMAAFSQGSKNSNKESGVVSGSGSSASGVVASQETGPLKSTLPGPGQTTVSKSQMRGRSAGASGSAGAAGGQTDSRGGSAGSSGGSAGRGSTSGYGQGSSGSYGRGSMGPSHSGGTFVQTGQDSFVVPVFRRGSRDFWVCGYCETINENARTVCKVCGFGR